MTAYLIRRSLYGLSVLVGVVSLVFLIFNLKPGDASQMLLGQRATPEMIRMVEKDLGLDLPIAKRYVLYLNDLSFLSIHEKRDSEAHSYYDETKYGGLELMNFGTTSIVLKKPYLRRSYRTRRDVSDILSDALPGTFILAVSAISLALILGMGMGVWSALNPGSLFDGSALTIAVLGMSAPSFYMAIVISWLGGLLLYEFIPLPKALVLGGVVAFVFWLYSRRSRGWKDALSWIAKGSAIGFLLFIVLSWLMPSESSAQGFFTGFWKLPGTGLEPSGSLYEVDVFEGPYPAWRNLILPMLTLGIRPLAIIIQLSRNAMLEEFGKEYIRTAYAKGLSKSAVVWRHALRNTLNPVITAVSGWFASLLAGAVFVEFIFGWQGLGLELYEALINEDFTVVMGAVLFISSIFVVINLVVDILYGWIDPRVRVR